MKARTPDNLDELYESLPEDQRLTATILRELIFETLPEVREKKSYGAPFYFGRTAVCYVWPASITWGGKEQGTGVMLGFNRGRAIDPEAKCLVFKDRKTIGHLSFAGAEDIDVELITELLRAAWHHDQTR